MSGGFYLRLSEQFFDRMLHVKRRIHIVHIFLVQLLTQQFHRLAETGSMKQYYW